jgi:hypothetical protein
MEEEEDEEEEQEHMQEQDQDAEEEEQDAEQEEEEEEELQQQELVLVKLFLHTLEGPLRVRCGTGKDAGEVLSHIHKKNTHTHILKSQYIVAL